MTKYLENLLFNSNLDLSLSSISRDDPMRFIVRSRLGAPRIFLGLLFGIPCLFLINYAFRQQGIYLLISLVFCPPLAILSVLFGLTKQKKTFIPSQGKAVKSFQLLHIQRNLEIRIPKNGALLTYKRWSSGGKTGGCYFYHVEVEGLKGLGFNIAKNEKKRDDFAKELATFLGYEICDQGIRDSSHLSRPPA